MTNDSYSHVPATVTVSTAKLVAQLKTIDEDNLVDRQICAEAEQKYAEAKARIAAREAAAAPIRMILGVAAPSADEIILLPRPVEKVSLARPPKGPKKTHKFIALEQLSRSDKPLKVVEIISGAFDLYRKEIERTSLSPLLAKLLEAGLVEHDRTDARWRITDAGRAAFQKLKEGVR